MKAITLQGSKREQVGSKFAQELRNQGLVPAVLYGAGDPIHFSIDERELQKIIYTPDVFNVILSIDGSEYSSILKDMQFHPVTDRAEHADFQQLAENQPVTIAMPVSLTGSSIGVRNGGKLRQPVRKLRVKGMLAALPDNIEIDVTPLRIGQQVKIADLNIPGVEFLDATSSVVVAVKTARGALADEEEEETAAAEEEAPAETNE